MRFIFAPRTKDFFGSNAYPYDLEMVEERDGSANDVAFLQQIFPSHSSRLIDLGCGHGRHAGPLAIAGYDVTAVDYSERCVHRAVQRFPQLKACQADFERLPFRSGAFDGAYSLFTSVGLGSTSLRQTLVEAARVCRPGAVLVIDTASDPRLLSMRSEPLPGGVGFWIRFRGPHYVHQFNVSIGKITGLYRLRYSRMGQRFSELACTTGWNVNKIDYGSSLLADGRGQRQTIVCTRQ